MLSLVSVTLLGALSCAGGAAAAMLAHGTDINMDVEDTMLSSNQAGWRECHMPRMANVTLCVLTCTFP